MFELLLLLEGDEDGKNDVEDIGVVADVVEEDEKDVED